MRLRRVEITRFRGIEELRWDVGGNFVCLIGPGDSTKTTILDAIELALSPRWNVPFDDADFYAGKTDEPIIITVTVGDLPEELKSEAKFGFLVRGWSSAGELHDEPEEGDEPVLSIRLEVGSDLEPTWTVINDRNEEGKPIGARDRERLGCVRLGAFLDRHFAWGRGSVLSRLTVDGDGLNAILAAAARAARRAVAEGGPEKLKDLKSVAEEVQKIGADFGVAPKESYQPQLDVQSVSVGTGGLSLHDGQVPVRRAGLGTRRLLAVAMQRAASKTEGLSLIDEVEHGLEPHRVRHLLRVLRYSGEPPCPTHVLMTTHAPVVLGELRAEHLRVVRSVKGRTTVLPVPDQLQPVVRKASEAFLARKVVVCEGRTELGLCRGLDAQWAESGPSFGFLGVALADGGGTEAASVTQTFAYLGYDVALLGDSDVPLNPSVDELKHAGAKVFLWEGGVSLEQRMALDLPWEGVVALVQLAMEEHGCASVRDSVRSALDSEPLPDHPSSWADAPKLRKAIGWTAKKKGWFKRVDLAERLAEIAVQHWEAIRDTPLYRHLEDLRVWTHGN